MVIFRWNLERLGRIRAAIGSGRSLILGMWNVMADDELSQGLGELLDSDNSTIAAVVGAAGDKVLKINDQRQDETDS